MKKIRAIIICMIFLQSSSGQLPVPVDSVYRYIRENSIFRETADWTVIDSVFLQKLSAATTLQDTMKSLVDVFRQLNDVHSQIYLNNQYYGYYNVFDDETMEWIVPLNNKANAATGIIKTAFLQKAYAYIQVPGINAWGDQVNAFAQTINDSLCRYNNHRTKGVIVDLRLNGGGQLASMLAGLNLLFGDNFVGAETDNAGNVLRTWEIKGGNFYQQGWQATDIKSNCQSILHHIPVVVLISPVTKSSGSMTAIAFKQRPNTYFVGEQTADGYTTSNYWNQMADNLVVNIASAFVADSKGNLYKSAVDPDLTIHLEDNFEDLLYDKKVIAAIKWLRKNKHKAADTVRP